MHFSFSLTFSLLTLVYTFIQTTQLFVIGEWQCMLLNIVILQSNRFGNSHCSHFLLVLSLNAFECVLRVDFSAIHLNALQIPIHNILLYVTHNGKPQIVHTNKKKQKWSTAQFSTYCNNETLNFFSLYIPTTLLFVLLHFLSLKLVAFFIFFFIFIATYFSSSIFSSTRWIYCILAHCLFISLQFILFLFDFICFFVVHFIAFISL